MQTKQLEMYIINKQLFTYSLHAANFFKAIFKRFGNAVGFAGLSCVCGLVTYKNKHIFRLGKNRFIILRLYEKPFMRLITNHLETK